MKTIPRLFTCSLAALLLSACAIKDIKKEASYPTRPDGTDKILYSDQKRDTIWGEGKTLGDKLFGNDEEKDSTGLGVNSFLWRASLDTVAFMPVTSADPFGGVILTDWYENPETPGERYKLNIYILDKTLRSDGVKVSMFKQLKQGKGDWKDTAVDTATVRTIEDTILTRARQIKVAQTPNK